MSSSINQASNGKALGEATETLSDVLQKFLSENSSGAEIVDRIEGLDSLGASIAKHPRFKALPQKTKHQISKILNHKSMSTNNKKEPQSKELQGASAEFKMGYAKGIALSQVANNSNGQITGILRNILDGQFSNQYLRGLHKGASDHEKAIHGDRINELNNLTKNQVKLQEHER